MKKLATVILVGAMALSMAACTTANAAETSNAETKAADQMTGGWSKAASPVIPADVKAAIEKAASELDGATYEPIAYLESQVVAGMNHKVLCKITPVVPDAVAHYSIVEVYVDLEGKASITNTTDLEKTEENAAGECGAWQQAESVEASKEATDALAKAAEKKVGAEYKAVALLESQVVSGTNYKLLCEITTVTAEPTTKYAIVNVYQALDGSAEITDIAEFLAE